ncbi:MAG TPA: hypothetical protein VLQ45_09370 [Thermoanaerobaculia bacterium]|nr:hypothetical protein [Thermoanaerobaculia bacterium]
MKRSMWIGLSALVLAVAIPAAASTFVALSRGELVAQSDAIVQGRVLKVSSFWSPSGRLIVSEAMIEVEETIAGRAPSVVVLRTAGGTVGGYTIEAHGFPKFAVNDRLVLFVQGAGNLAKVTGYQQGQYRIVRDKAGIEMAVPTLGDGVRLLRQDGRAGELPKAVRLDDFKAGIRAESIRNRPFEN